MPIYQAEGAILSGPVVLSGNGADGGRYVDFQNATGDFIEWTIEVSAAGQYDLSWLYSNGSGTSARPLKLDVNGVTTTPSLGFARTTNWTTWRLVTQPVTLQAGVNTIRLTSIGSNGANFDSLNVTPHVVTPVAPNVTISDAVTTEGANRFLVFDVALSTASTETITLNLTTTDGTATGGLDYSQALEFSTDGISWQPAASSQVTFSPGQTALKVRLAVIDDAINEPGANETMTLSASVVSGTVNSVSDVGIGAIADNDNPAGTPFDQTFQAENATLSSPIIFSGKGADGGRYVDFQNTTGDFIEWTVEVATAGQYDLSWRYSNGAGTSDRPLQLDINGTTTAPSLGFARTTNWSTWGLVTQSVALQAGVNKIRLTTKGSSGANFDSLRVVSTSTGPLSINVIILDANATEGTNDFLVFNVSLSTASSESITLSLAAAGGNAKGGLIADFGLDPQGDPVDYANQEFEVSSDGGTTWQAAINGTQVTFAAGQTQLKVRLAINNDQLDEPIAPETMILCVASVISGTVNSFTDIGTGAIADNDGIIAAGAPITYLPLTDVRVEGEFILDFNGEEGGLLDKDGQGTGFTMVDPTSHPGNPHPQLGVVGYWADKVDVDPISGVLKMTTTAGLQNTSANNLDNALGVGLNVPSATVKLQTTLSNLPTPVGGNAQAGLWFGKGEGGMGSSEDNYIKLVVRSDKAGNYLLEAQMEQNGQIAKTKKVDIPENVAVNLSLSIDPTNERVTAQYTVGGTTKTLITFSNVPTAWFSFDQAGINPQVATRSFGGIFASHGTAAAPQVFTFDQFRVTESVVTPPPPPPPTTGGLGAIAFDRWSIPVNNATDMSFGPDGRLYVATLFGEIRAIQFDAKNRTVISDQLINTIKTSEGGNRLTLGLAVDPASTPDNIILWVAHSDGAISSGGLNSGKISRLSGPGFTQKQDIVVGLPRASANHATNNIEFGPDGKLYVWQGGNTGAGAATLAANEFGTRPEQPLSAALLVVDVPQWKANPANFNGNVASPLGEFIDQFYARKQQELGRPFTEVQVYASGLRNTYDGVFHSNGQIYAPDNGLGGVGTTPPVPRLGDPSDRNITTQLGQDPIDNPGVQSEPLNRIVQGGYYGHPNPYRDEVVFMDGTFQGLAPDADYKGHLDILGSKQSPDGIIEYTSDNFFGSLKGNLLISNYSLGDNITRVELSADGKSLVKKSTLIGGFKDPLPMEMGPNGTIFVGEFNGGKITVLESLGVWRGDLPLAPQSVLDSGSAVLNGKLYMVGGKTANAHLNSVYVYDPKNPTIATDDTWTTGLNLPGQGVENPAVVTLNGKLYAFGGSTAQFSGAVTNAAAFNPDTNPDPNITTPSWDAIAPMPTARSGATAQVLNGDIYVIGGMGADGASVNVVEIYDPETNTWSTGAPLQTRRDNPGAAVVGDKLYVIGGWTRNVDGTTVNDTLNTMEIYDPLTGQWGVGAPMPTGRRTTMVGTIDNKIQVVGGEAGVGNTVFSLNEEYNPLTNAWRSLPAITTARQGAAFGTINNVLYVAAGGIVAGSSFSNVVEGFTF
jgi:N-acetylneuraminic acid mutarotase/glucose/arabinose dehydrogenase